MNCKEIIGEVLEFPYKVDLVYAQNGITYTVVYRYINSNPEAYLDTKQDNTDRIKEYIRDIIRYDPDASTPISVILKDPLPLRHLNPFILHSDS